jgi:hypothetical protein
VKVLAAQVANEINHAATLAAPTEPVQEPSAPPAPNKVRDRKKPGRGRKPRKKST